MTGRPVRIAKAQGDAMWRLFMEHAAQLEKIIGPDYLNTLLALKSAITVQDIEDALTTGDPDAVVAAILRDPGITASVRDAIQQAIAMAGSLAAADVLPSAFRLQFDRYNPRAVEVIQRDAGAMVVGITDDVRTLIRTVSATGLRMGQNPRTTAREIHDSLGLTDSQWRAVANFRGLLERNDSAALDRQLRDRRYDGSLRRAIGSGQSLSEDKIDQQVAAYTRKFVARRAQTIMRTESIRALYQGQKLAWQQAFSEGKADPRLARRFWFPALDERTCPICMAIPDMNPDGVGFDEPFQTLIGTVDGPPDPHPNCRCGVMVTFDQ